MGSGPHSCLNAKEAGAGSLRPSSASEFDSDAETVTDQNHWPWLQGPPAVSTGLF